LDLTDTDDSLTPANVAEKISILDAVCMLGQAWKNVQKETIVSCFNKALSQEQNDLDLFADVSIPQNMNKQEFETLVDQDLVLDNDNGEDDNVLVNVEEDQEDSLENVTQVGGIECLKALATVREFCHQRSFSIQVHQSLQKIENECISELS